MLNLGDGSATRAQLVAPMQTKLQNRQTRSQMACRMLPLLILQFDTQMLGHAQVLAPHVCSHKSNMYHVFALMIWSACSIPQT